MISSTRQLRSKLNPPQYNTMANVRESSLEERSPFSKRHFLSLKVCVLLPLQTISIKTFRAILTCPRPLADSPPPTQVPYIPGFPRAP